VELGLLASNIVIGPLGQIIYHGSKMSEYNHKNEMHEKYHKDKGASKMLVYNKDGKKYAFSVPDGAKDRELAFLTRHPISNQDKQTMGKEQYKAEKGKILNLTKAQVKSLRESYKGEKTQPTNGWTIEPYPEQSPKPEQ
jgi:hypothetical protein